MSDDATLKLKDLYQSELQSLRGEALEFARDHPTVARELGLSGGKSNDPHVELLLQSFSYLAGRLRYQLEAEQTQLPDALLAQLYPHLAAPMPGMVVAQVEVRPDGANFANGWTLGRHRYASVTTVAHGTDAVECRFRTCYETPLWPLEAFDVGGVPTNHYDFLSERRNVLSVIRVRVKATGSDPIQDMPLSRLRFHIDGDDLAPYALYELLAVNLVGIALCVPGDPAPRVLNASALRWCGFEEEEGALPDGQLAHPGYRLLQEYFAFPEKFLFFEVDGLDVRGATAEFELLFLLNAVPERSVTVQENALKLNCVPLVNLFARPIDPVRLDQRKHEYHLLADSGNHRYCEISAIEQLSSVRPDGTQRRLEPYFAFGDGASPEGMDYFYALRRGESQRKSVPGTEVYISFFDQSLDPSQPPEEVVGGRALCTNRRLPERLRAGDALQLDGPGPVNCLRLLSKPTAHQVPRLIGGKPWALVSQLSLNYLSLTGGKQALNALKSMLRLHVGHGGNISHKQIDSIVEMHNRPAVRNVLTEYWRGFCRGAEIRMVIDEERFDGGSPVLFADVLRRFLALYANLNTFTQVTLESRQRKGMWKQWPPLVGTQPVL